MKRYSLLLLFRECKFKPVIDLKPLVMCIYILFFPLLQPGKQMWQ